MDVFARDRRSADLLLALANPSLTAAIAPGPVWIVRLQAPPEGAAMLEILSLVQRWLEAARLPWATVRYDGRNHLIRPSTAFVQFAAAMTEFTGDAGREPDAGERVYSWA